ncbi:MAG: 23S rRNA (guanosine(2251)-2'-O)-methyltransferase RlmB [Verrucomicrobiales bacterium]|nr:23S rRNA (guanosine(2251)-2'-O)-methyltransferase RlmB [Verrucomicrobiales bacterium]
MGRPRRQKTSGNRPREARANVHSSDIRKVARCTEESLYSFLENPEGVDPFFLVLDGVQDPHNLGACIRSAEGAGVQAVVVPRHKSAPVTETVVRVSCGGAEHVPVVSVGNMARFLSKIREEYGVKIVGTADQSDCELYECEMTGPLAVVLGAEGEGMRRLTRENCNELISIPMAGHVECLNVSNAAAVCLFEAVRQRLMLELGAL